MSAYPYCFGLEGSGVVVGLPSDPETLEDDDFIQRTFKIGSKVVFVSPSLLVPSGLSEIGLDWTRSLLRIRHHLLEKGACPSRRSLPENGSSNSRSR